MKSSKLSGRELERHEAKRDVWREVLDGIDEIKAGGGKRVVVEPKIGFIGG
ncbi:MAG TPA: hypothetical protein PK556_00715 [Smithellaceae bacterium]|nr:hypothetical protein [Smithellaceae bacterium]